jgi:hypothetical protein
LPIAFQHEPLNTGSDKVEILATELILRKRTSSHAGPVVVVYVSL